MEILNIFISGIIILLGAIFINTLFNLLGILTWYGYINIIIQQGFWQSFSEAKFSLFFLYFIYPLLLGVLAKYSMMLKLF